MTEITDNKNVSQRELSRKLGLSLGTINVLINKMIKEGVIKMEQVSQKQVMYMLTPVGMVEKAKKTISYIKSHYRAIYETKEKIKSILDELNLEYENIFILKSDDEIGKLIELAVTEYQSENKPTNIKIVNENFKPIEYQKNKKTVLLYAIENQKLMNSFLKTNDVKMVNLLERL
jgi:DNA-binding Lrp family transcriptional regulator